MKLKKWIPYIFVAAVLMVIGFLVFQPPIGKLFDEAVDGFFNSVYRASSPPPYDPKTHPAKQVGFWSEVISRPLERRIIEAPPMLIDHLDKDNAAQGWKEHPRSMKIEKEFRADLAEALRTLPEAVKEKLDSSLAFVAVVRELGGTAYSDQLLLNGSSLPMGFVVLDGEVLRRRANEWATWKENTPFQQDEVTKLVAKIEEDPEDNRRQAIQYILLHEIGHVISFSIPGFPATNDSKDVVNAKIGKGEFLAQSWFTKDASRFDEKFPWRKLVRYYGTAETQIPIDRARHIYRDLAETDFPTLYAVTRFHDDFAESFASYVHTELMGKPWEIRIIAPGAEDFTYRSCWKEARCKSKRLILESVLGL